MSFQKVAATESATQILADFSEDNETAWVPDVLDRLDYPQLIAQGLRRGIDSRSGGEHNLKYRRLNIPRPNGEILAVVDLPIEERVALHLAVLPLRNVSDSLLDPGVCGYRQGAIAGDSHRGEYMRFRQMTQSMAEDSHTVISIDVSKFFDSVTLGKAAESVMRLAGAATAASLFKLSERWRAYGIKNLPAGYGDARLLGNIVLAAVDQQLYVPFTRWVDDYRLFLSREDDPASVVDSVERALGGVGLRLNVKKIEVESARDVVAGPMPLTSVYHPDRDPDEVTRSALVSVFARAAVDPIRHRRELRFTLPRLADMGIDVATEFCLGALCDLPWEAPRLIGYLDRFSDQPKVRTAVLAIAKSAARDCDGWMLARLAPILCKINLDRQTIDALRNALMDAAKTQRAIAWGSIVRILGCAGDLEGVENAVRGEILEPRAALGAMRDVGISAASNVADLAPTTANALSTVFDVPIPSAATSL